MTGTYLTALNNKKPSLAGLLTEIRLFIKTPAAVHISVVGLLIRLSKKESKYFK
ncbi:MAG: hypothetical protein JWQ79_2402 [Mucilaginibacter sp.]|nr:hypothetical protein [Mucilaginibacter sp.]